MPPTIQFQVHVGKSDLNTIPGDIRIKGKAKQKKIQTQPPLSPHIPSPVDTITIMSSIIRRLIDRFYPDTLGHRVTILGLDYSGKTTLLYLLKLGEIVTTVPSIGFNIETIDIKTSSGKPFRMTGWDIGTGCGGIRFLFGMIRMYLNTSSALIWVVDGCDRNRLKESVDALSRILFNYDADTAEDKSSSRPKLLPILM